MWKRVGDKKKDPKKGGDRNWQEIGPLFVVRDAKQLEKEILKDVWRNETNGFWIVAGEESEAAVSYLRPYR